MFNNIKKLSEFSLLLNERLVYDGKSMPAGAPGEIINPWVEQKKAMAERLRALKESVGNEFKKHLDEHEEAVLGFLANYDPQEYEKGAWKKWNTELLTLMGFKKVSEEDAKGVISSLQMYLKTKDKSVVVDGEFGRELLLALRRYYDWKEKPKDTPEAVEPTAKPAAPEEYDPVISSFTGPEGVDQKYSNVRRTKAGKWLDAAGREVRPEDALPKVAAKTLGGEIYYMKDIQKNKEFYFKKNGKEAHQYKDRANQKDIYFRLNNGKWINKDGTEKMAKEVIPKVATMTYSDKNTKEIIAYGLFDENPRGDYYNPNGERVMITSAEMEGKYPLMTESQIQALFGKEGMEMFSSTESETALQMSFRYENHTMSIFLPKQSGMIQFRFDNGEMQTVPSGTFPPRDALTELDIQRLADYIKGELEKESIPTETPPAPKNAVETPDDIQYRLPIEGLTWKSMQDAMRKVGFQPQNAFFDKKASSYHFPFVYANISGDFVISKEGGMNYNLKSNLPSSLGEKAGYVSPARELLNKDRYEAADMPRVMETVMNKVKNYRDQIISARNGVE